MSFTWWPHDYGQDHVLQRPGVAPALVLRRRRRRGRLLLPLLLLLPALLTLCSKCPPLHPAPAPNQTARLATAPDQLMHRTAPSAWQLRVAVDPGGGGDWVPEPELLSSSSVLTVPVDRVNALWQSRSDLLRIWTNPRCRLVHETASGGRNNGINKRQAASLRCQYQVIWGEGGKRGATKVHGKQHSTLLTLHKMSVLSCHPPARSIPLAMAEELSAAFAGWLVEPGDLGCC